MPRKRHSKLRAPLALQPAAPFFPTSSAAGENLFPLLQLDGVSHAASGARPPPSRGRHSPPKGLTAATASIAPTLCAQAGPQPNAKVVPNPEAAPVATVWHHMSFPKLFPSDQGSGAPGGQIKRVPRPQLAVEEPESVSEDSERNADNQLPSAEEEAEPGPSKRPTTKRKVAVSPGDVCRFRNKLYPVLELPSYTTVTLTENSDEDFEGPSRTSLSVETGNVVKMLADSTNFSPLLKPRCGARGSTRPCSSTKEDHIPLQLTLGRKGAKVSDQEESSSPLDGEECLPRDIDCDSSVPDTRATGFLASLANKWVPRGLALEYLLTPLNTLKKYSSQNFNQQVENYFKRA
ncbi:uncharacterized protein LOC123364732 [Mauremys mutica]|nr:uncharacterized protein LOC123364732 [Mauremys mutica]